MHIDKSVFRYIEHELYCYDATKHSIEELRDEIISGKSGAMLVPGTGYVSDPTAQKAVKLVSSPALAHMERTVRAIERAIDRLSEEHAQLFELKYRQNKHWKRVCIEMPTSERTYFRLRKELVLAVACELGLVNAYEVM